MKKDVTNFPNPVTDAALAVLKDNPYDETYRQTMERLKIDPSLIDLVIELLSPYTKEEWRLK